MTEKRNGRWDEDRLRRLRDISRREEQEEGVAEEAPRPRRPPFTRFESWIDRQIQQAQERGLFNNLRGTGQPLAPEDQNQAVFAGDDALGLKLLKNAEALPAWIELNKEIRADRQECQRILDYYIAERDRERRARLAADFRRRAAELNRKIDHYNLIVPAQHLEQIKLRIDLELREADQRRWAAMDRRAQQGS